MVDKIDVIKGLDEFTRAYLSAALWASDDGEQPLDKHYGLVDIALPMLQQAIAECDAFQSAHSALIQTDLTTAGYDFFLTRNHHGSGYWDGAYSENDGNALTIACRLYPSIDLYVGEDGEIHC
jgi:hypothetical protein